MESVASTSRRKNGNNAKSEPRLTIKLFKRCGNTAKTVAAGIIRQLIRKLEKEQVRQ